MRKLQKVKNKLWNMGSLLNMNLNSILKEKINIYLPEHNNCLLMFKYTKSLPQQQLFLSPNCVLKIISEKCFSFDKNHKTNVQ